MNLYVLLGLLPVSLEHTNMHTIITHIYIYLHKYTEADYCVISQCLDEVSWNLIPNNINTCWKGELEVVSWMLCTIVD